MRKLITAAVAGSMLVATIGTAVADDIGNDVPADVVTEVKTIEFDLADGTTQSETVTFSYEETNTDGKNGCNLGGQHSQVRFDVVATAVTGAAVAVSPSVVTFTDCNAAPTITVGGAGLQLGSTDITLSYKDHVSNHSPLGASDWKTAGAAFTVVVLDSTVVGSLDAPEIANAYLAGREDNAGCREKNGTNRNKANWHGQLISRVAKEFQGQTFTEANKHIVESYVEAAC